MTLLVLLSFTTRMLLLLVHAGPVPEPGHFKATHRVYISDVCFSRLRLALSFTPATWQSSTAPGMQGRRAQSQLLLPEGRYWGP